MGLQEGNIVKIIRRLWWLPYGLGVAGMATLVVGAAMSSPDMYDVYLLGGLAITWMALCACFEYLANRSHREHVALVQEMEHLFAYVHEMNVSIQESLEALATYDRDKAVEVATRLNSYTAKSLYDAYWREESPHE